MNVNSSSLTKTCKLLGWMGKKQEKKEINCNTQNKMWICCYIVIGLFVQKKNVHLNENWISSGKYAYKMSELTKEIETKSSWKKIDDHLFFFLCLIAKGANSTVIALIVIAITEKTAPNMLSIYSNGNKKVCSCFCVNVFFILLLFHFMQKKSQNRKRIKCEQL